MAMRPNLPNVTHILWEELEAECGPIQMKMCPFHLTLSPPCAAWIIFQSAVLTSQDCWESLALLFPTFLVSATTPSQSVLTERPSFDPHFFTSDPLSVQVYRTAPCPSRMLSGWLHLYLFLSYQFLSAIVFLLPMFQNWLHTPLGGRA